MLSNSVQQLPTRPCVSCGRPVILAVTVNNKTLPVDPEPTEDGTAFVRFEAGRLRVALKSTANPNPPGVPYVVHYATCPAGKPNPKGQDQ